MEIYVVQSGDTLFSIGQTFGVPLSQITLDNGLEPAETLVPGQALVLRFPALIHTVRSGETLSSIARSYDRSLRELYRNNPALAGNSNIWQGQKLVISYEQTPSIPLVTNGYAYPSIDSSLLSATLPFLTYLTPFTYGFTPSGALVAPEDGRLLATSFALGTSPLMHLSTLTENGSFSNELSHQLLNDTAARQTLLQNIITALSAKGYRGLDVDFEYVHAEDAGAYADFLSQLAQALHPLGYPLIAALAPKTSSDQKGTLYEGHDYSAIGAVVDRVFLMTYEWGYTYGPPMAVAPLPNVRQVVEYARTEIPAEKIWLGVPLYGYDWSLPFVQGESRATSLSPQRAIALARQHGASISYDEQAQAPWFRYQTEDGVEHEVWFEDARSIRAKLELVAEYGLSGVGYWSLMREFPQNWVVLHAEYQIS